MDIDEILGQIKPPEDVVPLCLRADLQADWERAERELWAARDKASTSLAGSGKEIKQLAEQVRAIEDQMQASIREFRLRAVGSKRWSDLKAANPGREGKYEEFNPETFGVAVLAACSIDPVMTEEQAGRLIDAITEGQWQALQNALGKLNGSGVSVPKSAVASEILQSTKRK